MENFWLLKTAHILWNFIEQNPFAHIALAVWLIFSVFYVWRAFKCYEKISPFLLQSIPFGFTMLGLLGTVAGCLIFSWGYKPLDFMSGVQTLFKGVMAASVTTILGIMLSIVFGKVIGLTKIKHETKMALENNEVTVLKKMLRLLVADYERQDTFQDNELMAIDSVRDAIFYAYPKMLKRMDSLKKAATTEAGEGVATLVEKLAVDLRRQAALMARSQETHTARMESLLQALAGEGDASLLGQLRALRAEQTGLAKVVARKMVEAVEKVGAIDMRPLAAGIDASLRVATGALLVEMKNQTQQAAALAVAADKRFESMERALETAAVAVAAADPTQALVALDAKQALQFDAVRRLSGQNKAHHEAGKAAVHDAAAATQAQIASSAETLRSALNAQNATLAGVAAFTREAPEKIIEPLARLQSSQNQGLDHMIQAADSLRDALATQAADVEQRVAAAIESVAEARAKAVAESIQRVFAEYGGRLRGQLERIERKTEIDANAGREAMAELDARQARQADALRTEIGRIAANLKGSTAAIQELAGASQSLLADTGRIKKLIAEMVALADTDKTLQTILDKVNNLGANGLNELSILPAVEPLGRSVEQLIARLREIEDIRNTDGKFWKQVQKQINDGIPIIMGGNKLQFREGIDLDGEFQDRLSKSFLNLDKILQTIVDGYQKKVNGAALRQ